MNPFKKYIIMSASAAALTASSNAAVVTYDFNSGLDDSTSGADLSATAVSYALGTQSDGDPQSFRRGYDPNTASSGDHLLYIDQRGLGSTGTDDAALTMTGAATLRFELTPSSG